MRRAASLVFGIIAVVSTLSLGSFAQEFSGTVQTVPNPHAQPLITAKVDVSDLAPLAKKPDLSRGVMKGAKDIGSASESAVMGMELVMRRPFELQELMDAYRSYTQSPDTPLYGKTLTAAEFAKNFGIASSDLTTLTAWLQSQGFEVGNVDNGRLAIRFTGTVAQVETAFHTEIHNYTGADGAQHFAPATEMEIPAALRPAIAYISGLNNFRTFAPANFGAPATDFAAGTTDQKIELAGGGNAVEPKLTGDMLDDASFTASSYAMAPGGALTLNLRLGGANHPATGSVSISDNGKVLGTFDISTCESYNGGYGRSCTADYTLATVGSHAITAVYSGDEYNRGSIYNVISHATGTGSSYTVVQPLYINPQTSSETFYTVSSWAGIAQLTGTVTVSGEFGTLGKATYPTAGNTTSSGSGNDWAGDPYTYTCSYNSTDKVVACTIVEEYAGYAMTDGGAIVGEFAATASYAGDTNYTTSSGVTDVYWPNYVPQLSTTVTTTAAPTAGTYGATQSEPAFTFTLTGQSGYGNPGGGGTKAAGNQYQFVQLTGPTTTQLGTLGTVSAYSSTCNSTTTYACTITTPAGYTIPAVVTPGTYSLTLSFSGNSNCSRCYYESASTTISYTEKQQAPTPAMTSPTAASPTTQTYGALAAFTVTGTLAWTGVGAEPTPSDISFTSTAGGTFGTVTCTPANGSSANVPTSPLTCSATFTPTSTDAAGSYNINLKFSGDVNYLAESTSVTGNYVITGATPTVSLSNVSAPYGSTAPQSITVTATGDNGATATFGTAGGVGGSFSPPSCVIASNTCSVSYIPSGTLAIGTYANDLTVSVAAYGNYSAGSATSTLTITADMTTLTLSADTPGSTADGVTQVNLTATMSPAITGVTVTFTDSTTGSTYQAQTNGSGAATVLITTSTTGVSGGLNSFVASVPAGSTYTAATSNTQNVYLQGVLLSSAAPHDFSVCYTNGGSGPGVVGCGQATYPADSVGTVAGSPLCNGSNGTNGYTCTTGYAVTVLNFTPNNETVSIDLINSNQGTNAFSYQTNCPATLQPYGTTTVVNGNTVYEDRCTVAFYYLPPYGDGSSTTAGRYEAGSWSLSGNAGTLLGIGDPAFDRSGSVTFPETLSGFAVLPASNPVSVTPMSLTFGPQASGALSATQNIVVMNNGSTSIGLTFTPPTPSQFIVTNGCPNQLAAGASCSIGVAFQSSTSGTITGTLVITPAGASPITVNLSGTVASTPGYYLNSSGHNFGNISDGTTVTSGFTVTNNSGAPANFTIMPSGSSEFSITSNTCASQLAAGSSCSISVTFAPTAPGAASYSITMSTVTGAYQFYPGGTIQATVTFTGTGVAGGKVMVGTSTHNFGDVQIGSTGTNYGVTLTNTTGAAVTLTYSSLSGTEFAVVQSQTNCGGTLANNASCQMAFSFTPTASGFTSQLYSINVNGASDQVYSNAAGTYVNGITLEGTGTSTP